MQGKKGKQNNGILLAAFLLLVFAGTWQLTKMTPLVGDDFNYAFSWADDTRVDNFTLVVKSMISHRQWTHGRVFAQGWVTLFMMWPRWVFPLANAGIVTAFFASLYHFFNRIHTCCSIAACAIVAALYWICMPAFGQVFLWLDGACNYFWGAAFAWILLELMWTAKNSRYAPLWTGLLLPMAFAVGAWSEHISFAFLVILFLSLIKEWIQKKKLPVIECVILLSSFGGYLFLMFAPSMLPTKLKILATRATSAHFNTAKSFVIKKWWLLVILLVILILLILWLKRKPTWRSRWTSVLLCCTVLCLVGDLYFAVKAVRAGGIWGIISSTQTGFLTLMSCFSFFLMKAIRNNTENREIYQALMIAGGGLCSLFLFTVADYVPARGFCAPVVFISIATVMLWKSGETGNDKEQRFAVTALGGLFLFFFIPGMLDLIHIEQAAAVRDRAIERALASDGILYAVPYPVKTKYSAQYGIQDLAEGEYWPNTVMAQYYGLTDIVVLSDLPGEGS